MWENAGKMKARITPNTGTFYAVFLSAKKRIPILYIELQTNKILLKVSKPLDL